MNLVLTEMERKLVENLCVFYYDVDKDPDLVINPKNGRYEAFRGHQTTVKDFTRIVKRNGLTRAWLGVDILWDEKDKDGSTVNILRHYKKQSMEISISEKLDGGEWLPLLFAYFKENGFAVGDCSFAEEMYYDARAKADIDTEKTDIGGTKLDIDE